MRPGKAVLSVANWVARRCGLVLLPAWRWDEVQGWGGQTFRLAGRDYPFFTHHYNCGRHPETATERTVELPLADRWLARAPAESVVEVGAVTPYYWPGRVSRVVDPADTHPQVTDRRSLLDVDLTGRAVLCLSTLEHVGSGEYGQPTDAALLHRAVEKLFAEAVAFLVTIPVGYAQHADAVLFDRPRPADVIARYLVRQPGPPYWAEVTDAAAARRPYGPTRTATGTFTHGANALAVWERGSYFSGEGPG